MQMIQPVILSGGAGTRLWPLSRQAYPKQLLALNGQDTMLQATSRRVSDGDRFAAPLIVCNDEHRFIIAEQMRAIDVDPLAIVLEPVARNTAPAIVAAALMATATAPEAILLVLPSDHEIRDVPAFQTAVHTAATAARAGALVTFGITPDSPHTGYGYIRRGAPLADVPGCFEVARFVEKPKLERAQAFFEAGDHVWNSGMFVFRADSLLAEVERLQPDILAACGAAVAGASKDLTFVRLDADAFARSPSISIDNAVMEPTDKAAMVAANIGWSDVGSWGSLWEIQPQDSSGNALSGDVVISDVKDSYIRAENRLVAAVGLEDAVVVETADAVLVAGKGRSQDVRAIVDQLAAAGRSEVTHHQRVHRPWGYYEGIDIGDRYQVKHLLVHPGRKLSLQLHHHRAEHWVVVQGTARVTRGDEVILLEENQSIYIPLGTKHRLENPGKIDLRLIEVQSGAYLGEDDIVRFDDDFGRDSATNQ